LEDEFKGKAQQYREEIENLNNRIDILEEEAEDRNNQFKDL